MATTYKYNDGRRPGARYPRLYLARGGEVRKFFGESIPGYCVVVTAQYTKAGKWSNTDYELALLPGVRPIYLVDPLHGTWGDDLRSWGEAATRLGLPIEVVRDIVAAEFPTTARRLDEIEASEAEAEAEDEAVETETVIVSFGAPTSRQIADGYWEAPKTGVTADGRAVVVAPDPDWTHPRVVEPEGAVIVGVRHSPGPHGGYWAVEVVVRGVHAD